MNPVRIEPQDDASAIAAAFGRQLKNPAMPFALMVRFQVRDGTQDEVEAAFARASTKTRSESGVIAFDLNREAGDPTRFVVYERWRTLADLEAHLRTPHVAA